MKENVLFERDAMTSSKLSSIAMNPYSSDLVTVLLYTTNIIEKKYKQVTKVVMPSIM
jgi:hypothetical protein